MSRVRTGHGPEDWLDLGESRGRMTVHGFTVMGGPIVAVKLKATPAQLTAAVTRRPRDIADYPRCGAVMKDGVCGRRPGHGRDRGPGHRSVARMALANERRRARMTA